LEEEGFRSKVRENIKQVRRNSIRKVRDNSNAVPDIGGLVCRCVSRRGGMRKSRGRVRM